MMDRRAFLFSLAAAGLASRSFALVKDRKVKITKLFKSPEGHPNALEATPEGLWVGEEVSDIAYLLDWKSGEVLKKVQTESSNTSGMAYGGGYLWMAANGKGLWRDPRPTDANAGEVIKVDPATGKTVARYPVPDGGGLHGLLYRDGTLWMTCFKWKTLAQVDIKDFKVIHQIPIQLSRPHGLAWDSGAIWCVFSNDFVIQKLSAKDGEVLEQIQLDKETDPDPHGLDIHQGSLYLCDAGIAPGAKPSNSPRAGYIYRLDFV